MKTQDVKTRPLFGALAGTDGRTGRESSGAAVRERAIAAGYVHDSDGSARGPGAKGPKRGTFLREARVRLVRNPVHELKEMGPIHSSRDVYKTMAPLVSFDREVAVALFLSSKNDIIGYEINGVGGINRSSVSVGPLLRTALLVAAAAIIMVHNHPSGDPRPSPEDVALTETVFHAAQAVELDLLDHVIVGDGRWHSFMDEGAINALRIKGRAGRLRAEPKYV